MNDRCEFPEKIINPYARKSLVGTPGLNVTWTGEGLIVVVQAGIDMDPLASHVADFDHVARSELARNLNVPIISRGVGVFAVRRQRDRIEERVRRIQGRRHGVFDRSEWIDRRIGDCEASGSGRIQVQDVDVVGLTAIEEDPESRTNDDRLRAIISEADPWAKVPVAGFPNGVQRLAGRRVEDRDTIPLKLQGPAEVMTVLEVR